MTSTSPHIVIIGAGPTGLGAAYRCRELGHENVLVLEKEKEVGGLARSFHDPQGFTWDIGAHVLFTTYPYFRDLYEKLMGGEYTDHVREAWIWMRKRYLPYPFQYNLHHLSSEEVWRCVEGLLLVAQGRPLPAPNFRSWILQTFGEGMAKAFLFPYNEKTWSCDLTTMSCQWIADRVPPPDLMRMLRNVVLRRDDMSWGPNSLFKFPSRGGTGDFFRRFVPHFQPHLRLGTTITGIDTTHRRITTTAEIIPYDLLITTMPLPEFLRIADLPHLVPYADRLRHTAGIIIGLGVRGQISDDLRHKVWIYTPEPECPFYRISIFSNYSAHNAPAGCYSLMAEVATLPGVPIERADLVQHSLSAMRHMGLLPASSEIVSEFFLPFSHSYPIPTIDRDEVLGIIQPHLLERGVYSRGRFGAWKYEIGNMDHSVMQGVEVVSSILQGTAETVWSL